MRYLLNRFMMIIMISLVGCQPSDNQSILESIEPFEIDKPVIFVESINQGLYLPGQIVLLDNGYIAVLDYPTNEVLVFDPEAELINRFGGEGQGPGETVAARYLQKTENYLYVIDPDLLRVNQFSKAGNFIKTFSFDTGMAERIISVKNGGVYFQAAMGENGTLIRKTDTKSGSTQNFGKAMGEEYRPGDMEIERRRLQQGEIPELFKNRVTMYFSNDHLYVFLGSYSLLQKYTAEGELIWESQINLPVNDRIFERAVERAREPGAPGTVPTWRFITSMKVISGNIYLLWTPFEETPRQLVSVNESGEIDRIYHIPEKEPMFADFTIDPENNLIYFTAPETGQLYRSRLP